MSRAGPDAPGGTRRFTHPGAAATAAAARPGSAEEVRASSATRGGRADSGRPSGGGGARRGGAGGAARAGGREWGAPLPCAAQCSPRAWARPGPSPPHSAPAQRAGTRPALCPVPRPLPGAPHPAPPILLARPSLIHAAAKAAGPVPGPPFLPCLGRCRGRGAASVRPSHGCAAQAFPDAGWG